MRVVVYDEAGDVAFDYHTQKDTVSLCPGRLEKAQVVEALQEAAFFIMEPRHQAPRPATFDSMCLRGITESDWARGASRRISPSCRSYCASDQMINVPRDGPCEIARLAR